MPGRNVPLDTVIIAGRELRRAYDWVAGKPSSQWAEVTGPLEVDLNDPERGIAVEYVARDDFDRLGGNESDWSMNMKEVASSVGREVAKQGRGVYFGAFYDPVKYFSFGRWGGDDERWASSPEDAEAEAAELLREQVKDFIDWLEGQGVI
jgi:hypothetical protein